MSEDQVKAATLEPVHDSELLQLVSQLIDSTHSTLADAKVRVLWAIDKPLTFWGRAKVATEETWWLSRGDEEGTDIVLHVNKTLWNRLMAPGRRFILDHFLDQVRLKESGQVEMETAEGTRLLYQRAEGTLKINPVVLARNPEGIREIDELERLWTALAEPTQFAIKFAPKGEEEPGERPEAIDVTPARPVYLYERRNFTELGPTAVRYANVLAPAGIDGVFYFDDDAEMEVGDLGALKYDNRKATILKVRAAVEAEDAEFGGPSVMPMGEEETEPAGVAH